MSVYRSSYNVMSEVRANATAEQDEASLVRNARKPAALPYNGGFNGKSTNEDRSWKRHRQTQYRA